MVFSLAEATADKSAVGSAEQGTLSFLRRSNFCLNFPPFQLKQRTNYQRFNGILNQRKEGGITGQYRNEPRPGASWDS
jgi:hypothetical protein